MSKLGLYIHIPFCRRICSYCDFAKRVSNQNKINKYVDYLLKEIELYKKNNFDYSNIYTIYIGGGTPSSIGLENLEKIFSRINSIIDKSKIIEYSIEVNPEDLNDDLIFLLKKYNVNRVSIGIQTFDKTLLKLLNREFDIEKFINNYYKLKESISNINLDLMYAIPGQTIETLKETIEIMIRLNPKHVSLYSLILEEKTVFYHLYNKNKLTLIDESLEREMYDLIHSMLAGKYFQYEVSNYCQKNYESRHNLIYWNNDQYLGLGVSSASFFENRRFRNTTNLEDYFFSIDIEKFPIIEEEILTEEDIKKYHIILGFRLINGINLKGYQERFKSKLVEDFPIISTFINDGYFEIVDNHIRIKKEYIYVMDHFLEQII